MKTIVTPTDGDIYEDARQTLALTPRQREILTLITSGHTSKEIAQQLKISPQTVEVHRYSLMRRLNVRNVAELIRQAMLLHYLPQPTP